MDLTGLELVIFGGGRLAGDGAADDLQMEQQRDENLVELAMVPLEEAIRSDAGMECVYGTGCMLDAGGWLFNFFMSER